MDDAGVWTGIDVLPGVVIGEVIGLGLGVAELVAVGLGLGVTLGFALGLGVAVSRGFGVTEGEAEGLVGFSFDDVFERAFIFACSSSV